MFQSAPQFRLLKRFKSKYLLLSRVNIPQSNVHQVSWAEKWLSPGEPRDIWHLVSEKRLFNMSYRILKKQ